MEREHAASIRWTAEYVERGLPSVRETIDPAWFMADPVGTEGWSLVCRFEVPPAEQGSPSAARVSFWMPAAPHDRLTPGIELQLFERGTQRYATVVVLD